MATTGSGVYSFINTQASIVGPGGSFSISEGGIAEEGITIRQSEDDTTKTMGSDGSGMYSVRADNSGELIVRLLKTSPLNAQLMVMRNYQKLTPGAAGRNTISLYNTDSGDVVNCSSCAFRKVPDLTYAVQGGMNEWAFHALQIARNLGNGDIITP